MLARPGRDPAGGEGVGIVGFDRRLSTLAPRVACERRHHALGAVWPDRSQHVDDVGWRGRERRRVQSRRGPVEQENRHDAVGADEGGAVGGSGVGSLWEEVLHEPERGLPSFGRRSRCHRSVVEHDVVVPEDVPGCAAQLVGQRVERLGSTVPALRAAAFDLDGRFGRGGRTRLWSPVRPRCSRPHRRRPHPGRSPQ